MPDTPRIILHNSETARLSERLCAAFPQADHRECNSYADLPNLIDSYKPKLSIRFERRNRFQSELSETGWKAGIRLSGSMETQIAA